jgi:hypothetical protein
MDSIFWPYESAPEGRFLRLRVGTVGHCSRISRLQIRPVVVRSLCYDGAECVYGIFFCGKRKLPKLHECCSFIFEHAKYPRILRKTIQFNTFSNRTKQIKTETTVATFVIVSWSVSEIGEHYLQLSYCGII